MYLHVYLYKIKVELSFLKFATNYASLSKLGYMPQTQWLHTVELKWLEHPWKYENMFETGVFRASDSKYMLIIAPDQEAK